MPLWELRRFAILLQIVLVLIYLGVPVRLWQPWTDVPNRSSWQKQTLQTMMHFYWFLFQELMSVAVSPIMVLILLFYPYSLNTFWLFYSSWFFLWLDSFPHWIQTCVKNNCAKGWNHRHWLWRLSEQFEFRLHSPWLQMFLRRAEMTTGSKLAKKLNLLLFRANRSGGDSIPEQSGKNAAKL